MRFRVPVFLLFSLAVPAFSDGPFWTFGVDGEGRFGVVSASSDGVASVSVPSVRDGEPVRAVGTGAFAGCQDLREVRIPASVEWIDPYAFEGCRTLEKIVVDGGSSDYSSRDGLLFDETGTFLLTCPEGRAGTCIVPDGTAEIDAGAFAGCAALVSVVLPPDVERAGAGVFSGCTALESLLLPAESPCDPAAMGVPGACRVVRYEPGGLDDPRLPARWAVSFRPNGGKGTMEEQVFVRGTAAALRANAFSRKGFAFAGWARSAGGAVAFADRKTVRDLAPAGGRIPLYARWKGVPYAIVFHDPASGGKVKQKFRYGTKQALVAKPFKRAGFVLVGWSKKKGGALWLRDGQKVKNLTSVSGKKIHVYAVWAVRKYKVSFQANGGTGTMAAQAFVFGKAQKLRANAFKRKGCSFVGWARKPSAAATIADGREIKALTAKGGIVKLYAKWKPNRYVVRFDPNGGKGSMADEAFVYGKWKKLRPNAFTRKGYRFLGWSKKAAATRPSWKDGKKVRNLTAKKAVIVLYAVWIKPNDPSKILCLGDSITEGYACAGLPYPARLAELTGRKVVNRGVGGTTSWDGLQTAEENILSARAGTVCILFGANDAIFSADPSEVAGNLRRIILLCREHGCVPVLGTPPHQSGSHARFDANASSISEAIRSLAKREGVSLADANAAFGHWDGYLNPDDGLHLSEEGGALLARLFRDAL